MTNNFISLKLLNIIETIEINNIELNNCNKKCDLVISGGGFSGFYHAGFFTLLKKLIKTDKIEIRNIYATSAGVLSSIFFLCDININEWLKSYYYCFNNKNNNIHSNIINIIKKILPKNAHELCSNKINITLTKLNYYNFESVIINKFETFEDLIKIVEASINIPYVISPTCKGTIINGISYYDGGFTKNTPIIYNNDLPQLLLKTHEIDYPILKKYFSNDPYLELLIFRGAIESYDFFTNNTNNKNVPIYWIDGRYEKKIKKKENYKYIKFFIPIFMFIYSIS